MRTTVASSPDKYTNVRTKVTSSPDGTVGAIPAVVGAQVRQWRTGMHDNAPHRESGGRNPSWPAF
ncbi:MAG: hypothetical protein LBU98_01610 [Alistipes sp.]|nr:hypothetical protein [Alistipes sp.]